MRNVLCALSVLSIRIGCLFIFFLRNFSQKAIWLSLNQLRSSNLVWEEAVNFRGCGFHLGICYGKPVNTRISWGTQHTWLWKLHQDGYKSCIALSNISFRNANLQYEISLISTAVIFVCFFVLYTAITVPYKCYLDFWAFNNLLKGGKCAMEDWSL